jgi:methionyl-tRNA synthetase
MTDSPAAKQNPELSTEPAPETPAPPKIAAGSPLKPEIQFEDFAKVDLRVAKILRAEPHPNADKLLRLQLDDGTGEPRQICAGIKAFYNADDLVGKTILIVANLAPRTLRGEESRGMLLAASDASKGSEERTVVLATLMDDQIPGAVVS